MRCPESGPRIPGSRTAGAQTALFTAFSHVDGRRRAVLESLVILGARLGARVVAEGIETLSDLEAVEALGIDLVQGYYFGKPCPVAELVSQLRGDC